MVDIKVKQKIMIKKLEKNINQAKKFKDDIEDVKEKAKKVDDENKETNGNIYAVNQVQNATKELAEKGIKKLDKYGKKSVTRTYQNIIEGKEKVANIKNKIKERKKIKEGTKRTIKATQNTSKFATKGIKTSEKAVKTAEKSAKEAVKMSKRMAKVAKVVTRKTIQLTKVAVKVTITIVKTIIAETKALISLIVAGGWIAVIVIIVVVLIGGVVAWLLNADDTGNLNYTPNDTLIIAVAKTEEGNEGGEKFWSWYGFESYQPWCACYVSYIADKCGYIEEGIIPKFSLCDDGITWFKKKERWKERTEYYPKNRRYNFL